MRVSRAQAEANRERVVEVASGMFRATGFAGTSIADLMQGAGLTHGGFYGNFASKEELELEASRSAFAGTQAALHAAIAGADDPLAALVHFYLSPAHRDGIAKGCAVAALAPDAARSGPALRGAFEAAIRNYLTLLAGMVGGADEVARHKRAMATLSTLVGALQLSRTVADPSLSESILVAAADSLLASA